MGSPDLKPCLRQSMVWPKAAFTSEHEQNANAACENDANVWCRCIPEARQTAFGFVTNVRRTAKCYPSTVGTSKGIRVQYVYVGSIRCLGECWTIYKFTHMNVRIVLACRVHVRIPIWTPPAFFTVTGSVFPLPGLIRRLALYTLLRSSAGNSIGIYLPAYEMHLWRHCGRHWHTITQPSVVILKPLSHSSCYHKTSFYWAVQERTRDKS